MDETIVRNKNIEEIYRLIYQNRQISRQEISRLLNISLPTTT
ncbi:winged helix-turn-helix transcriptional regulator, partial [Blautia sp.]